MHQNSLKAYATIVPDLNYKQSMVMQVFEDGNSYTDREIGERLGWAINKVTPRVGELIRKGKIEASATVEQEGRKCRACSIVLNPME